MKMRRHLRTRFTGRKNVDVILRKAGWDHHPAQKQPAPLQISLWGDAQLFCLWFLFVFFLLSFKMSLIFGSCAWIVFTHMNI